MPAQVIDLERRTVLATDLRAEDGEGGAPLITGHAAVFSQLSEDLGGFREQIAPGAFASALERKDDVRALWNHDPNFVLGRSRAGTLEMREDATGLAVRIAAPATQTIRDLVMEPIRRGDVSQMSFAFSVRPDGDQWAEDDDGTIVRTIRDVRLYDVSPVTFAAYPQTDVSVAQRSLATAIKALRSAKNPRRLDIARRRLDLAALL
ncbi:MAG: HK97 family phage prohead protease [Gammaproteobacteria bacterium]|nr:HK97 family phage prohead protease [Gammaproteobacteria bacterium]